MLVERSVLLLYLSVLQSHPKLHGPEQADLSMVSKDSQRTKWLEMGFSVFILAFVLDTWK